MGRSEAAGPPRTLPFLLVGLPEGGSWPLCVLYVLCAPCQLCALSKWEAATGLVDSRDASEGDGCC